MAAGRWVQQGGTTSSRLRGQWGPGEAECLRGKGWGRFMFPEEAHGGSSNILEGVAVHGEGGCMLS